MLKMIISKKSWKEDEEDLTKKKQMQAKSLLKDLVDERSTLHQIYLMFYLKKKKMA